MADASNPELLELTARIVAAHVGQNHLPAAVLPELIQSVYRSLATAGTIEPEPEPLVLRCRSASRCPRTTSCAWRTAGS